MMKPGRKTNARGILARTSCLAAGVGALSTLPGAVLAATIIENVTVVDTVTGGGTPGMSIVIDGDTITAVTQTSETQPSPSDTVIDATGLFAIPGLNDMHSHALTSGDAETNLRVMLANGITGYRAMSSTPELVAHYATGEMSGPVAGPDLLSLPGSILTDGNVRTPGEAVAEVDRQKQEGVDFIKILADNPVVFVAALDAAAADGLPIAGHFPPSVPAELAAEHGMDAMEHLGPRESMLLSASSIEDELRTEIANTPPPPPPAAPPPPGFYGRVIANPIPFTSPAEFDRMFKMAGTYDPEKAKALADVMRDKGVWQVPTLIRLRTMNRGDDPEYRNDPNLAYVTADQRALWEDIATTFASDIPEGGKDALEDFYATLLELTRTMADEGVPMLAGSDHGGQWLVAGFSLHQEFAELARAGLTPLQILQMSTLNAGRFLGREDRLGRIAPGMEADLVLLAADPIADVSNLDRIEGVVDSGNYLDRGALDATLAK